MHSLGDFFITVYSLPDTPNYRVIIINCNFLTRLGDFQNCYSDPWYMCLPDLFLSVMYGEHFSLSVTVFRMCQGTGLHAFILSTLHALSSHSACPRRARVWRSCRAISCWRLTQNLERGSDHSPAYKETKGLSSLLQSDSCLGKTQEWVMLPAVSGF